MCGSGQARETNNASCSVIGVCSFHSCDLLETAYLEVFKVDSSVEKRTSVRLQTLVSCTAFIPILQEKEEIKTKWKISGVRRPSAVSQEVLPHARLSSPSVYNSNLADSQATPSQGEKGLQCKSCHHAGSQH